LVLSVGETVEEATDTGFLATASTLLAANIGEDAFIQIHPSGIRHIKGDKRINEWKTPGKKTIIHASCNERQVVIALSGGDILYFELDQMGQLMEVDKKFMGVEIACVDIAPIPEGRQRSRFLVTCDFVFYFNLENRLLVIGIIL
jgi:splicing factor 3B subunit 3